MRNWHPYIADVVAQMRTDGVTHIKAVCLAPQNSRTSVGLYRRAVLAAAAGIEVEFVAGWAESPLLAQAFAEKLWPVWAEACARVRKAGAGVVYSAQRSVPDDHDGRGFGCRCATGNADAGVRRILIPLRQSARRRWWQIVWLRLGSAKRIGTLRFRARGSAVDRGLGRRWRRR